MNVKAIYIALSLILSFCLDANSLSLKSDPVKITATIKNCGGQIGLYKFDGVGFKSLKNIPEIAPNKFVFEIEKSDPQIYYIGKDNSAKMPILIGQESEIVFESNCPNIRNSIIVKSKLNKQYNDVIKTIQNQKGRQKQLMNQVRKAQGFPDMIAKAKEAVIKFETERSSFIDSMMSVNQFFGHLAAINSYNSYLTTPGNYENEVDHYGHEYFSAVPLENAAYDELTFLFESFREYATTFAKIGINQALLKKYLDNSLGRISQDRPAYKIALGGVVLGLKSNNHPAFIDYAKHFLEKYGDSDATHIKALAQNLEDAKSLIIGAEAPILKGMTPDGNEISLKDLRGKYVLIDFWASWCGPCRRENPNVVKLYEKYKKQGFEIFGVSLDRQKDRWVKAIADDGLVWSHISDLKGWKSAFASKYGVTSIPTTVLLDKEGKIIARNLRAHQLEGELVKLFKN